MKFFARRKIAVIRIFLIAAAFVGAVCSASAEPLDLATALRPLADGVPEVAATRLQNLLATPLPNEQRQVALTKLAEAFIAAEEPEKALKVLDDPSLRPSAERNFWRAQALAALRRWPEALGFYRQCAEADSPLKADALFGEGNTLRALNQNEEALAVYGQLFRDPKWNLQARYRATELALNEHKTGIATAILTNAQPQSAKEKQERRFLRGRLEAQLNHPEKAIELLQSIVKKPDEINHAMLISALFALTDVHLQLKAPEAADDPLEEFIENHPSDPDLAQIFAELDHVYQLERKPSRSELARWTHDSAEPRRAFAQWYLARADLRSDRRENAVENFHALEAGGARFPALAEGYLEFAQLEIEDGAFERALAILNAARGLQPSQTQLKRIDWLAAETHYRESQFETAAHDFEEVARISPAVRSAALFNASLGWLQVGNSGNFQNDYRQLSNDAGAESSRADLLLEEGLTEAAQGNPHATESLKSFLHNFPQNKRVSEAWVALAELAFHAAPPRIDEARTDLKRAMELQPTAAATERKDYLNIWIEDAETKDETGVIALANQFLQKHPQSPFAPEVRMKLAEAYYRRQDFANAQTQFEFLARQTPNGPFTEKALFFAGESAMASMGTDSLDRALTLFDEVVHKNGDLKWAARNEQAIVERKLDKPQEALVLYNEVLEGNAKPGEKREALCGNGDIYFELGSSDPKNYRRAIESYDKLIADPQVPAHWRNQALFKKGVCLEKTSENADALATFYQVLDGSQDQQDHPREFFWYYKAGFNAARLLEEETKWNAAVAIYQKLAAVGGTRSEEAQTRLTQLRLEHFLWDR